MSQDKITPSVRDVTDSALMEVVNAFADVLGEKTNHYISFRVIDAMAYAVQLSYRKNPENERLAVRAAKSVLYDELEVPTQEVPIL